MTVLIILFVASAAVAAALDVTSTAANNNNPLIREATGMFRDKNGHCNLKKLIIFKIALLAGAFIVAMIIYKNGGGVLSFLVFPVIAAVHIPIVLGNRLLQKKYSS